MLAPLGIAIYLLARLKLTGATSLDERLSLGWEG